MKHQAVKQINTVCTWVLEGGAASVDSRSDRFSQGN